MHILVLTHMHFLCMAIEIILQLPWQCSHLGHTALQLYSSQRQLTLGKKSSDGRCYSHIIKQNEERYRQVYKGRQSIIHCLHDHFFVLEDTLPIEIVKGKGFQESCFFHPLPFYSYNNGKGSDSQTFNYIIVIIQGAFYFDNASK